MRMQLAFGAIAVATLAAPALGQVPSRERLNPMIALHEKGLPVLGVTHPSISPPRGGRGGSAADVPPPAAPALVDVARETLAYRLADFQYNSYSPASADRFKGYMEAIIAQGGTMRTHAFISKAPIVHGNVGPAQARIIEQLNAGHAGVFMQAVESAGEVRDAIAAMRFRWKGGIRPDTGIALAAKYWGLTPAQYLERADVWPINPNGELVVYVIIESKAGVANVREIAAVPGVAALVVGAGTLGGVFTTTSAEGQRARDQAAFDAAVASVVAACREFKVACSYPANNSAEVERLMNMGFNVFTMQSRNQAAFDAVLTGRRVSGRPLTP
jgi:2-keto-3-deoxy-L-rhamnonate aldolase RhmA